MAFGAVERQRVDAILTELKTQNPDVAQRAALMQELAQLHQPLVSHVCRRYAERGEPLEDLTQVGMLAFVMAVERFDIDRGIDFAAFLTPTVMGELKKYFRDHTWAVRVPRGLQELRAQVVAETAAFLHQESRSPSVEEVAERLGTTRERVLEALEAAHAYTASSLDQPVGAPDGPALGDRLVDPVDLTVDVDLRMSIAPALEALPARERRIIELRFVEGWSQVEIATHLGISQMHVSRLLKRTLEVLREELRDVAPG